jgi:hypothetical protein
VIQEFEKLEKLRKARLDAQYDLRANRIDLKEFDKRDKELDAEQKRLLWPASKSLAKTEGQLKWRHQDIKRRLANAADAQAREVDYARLEFAHKHIERQLRNANHWQDVERVVRDAKETGDKHLIRAAYEEVLSRIENLKSTDNDWMHYLAAKPGLKAGLDELTLSPEQVKLAAERKDLEQQIVYFVQDVVTAREEFSPRPTFEEWVEGRVEHDPLADIGNGISLSKQDAESWNPSVSVELDESWDGPAVSADGLPDIPAPVYTGGGEVDPRWDGHSGYARES